MSSQFACSCNFPFNCAWYPCLVGPFINFSAKPATGDTLCFIFTWSNNGQNQSWLHKIKWDQDLVDLIESMWSRNFSGFFMYVIFWQTKSSYHSKKGKICSNKYLLIEFDWLPQFPIPFLLVVLPSVLSPLLILVFSCLLNLL